MEDSTKGCQFSDLIMENKGEKGKIAMFDFCFLLKKTT